MRGVLVRVAVVAVVTAVAIWLVWLLIPSTAPAADLRTYQAGTESFYETGDPYAVNAERGLEEQYRYPPLLAMVLPALEWAWFPLLALAWTFVFWIRWREAGPWGLLLPLGVIGLWGQLLIAGNAEAFVVAGLIVVPLHRRTGALGAAVATWLKIYPAAVVLFYIARRDWQALRWYAASVAVLGLIQLPWLDDYARYAMSDGAAVPAGMSPRFLGPAAWGFATVVMASHVFVHARHASKAWAFTVGTMLMAIPRIIVPTLALVLAHPKLLTPRIGRMSIRHADRASSTRS